MAYYGRFLFLSFSNWLVDMLDIILTDHRFSNYPSTICAKCQALDFPARENRLSNVARNNTKFYQKVKACPRKKAV